MLDYLEVAPIDQQERLWRFMIQHESQHCETVAFVLQMQQEKQEARSKKQEARSKKQEGILMPNSQCPMPLAPYPILNSAIEIPGGEFYMGSDAVEALDNERSRHLCYLEAYSIDRYPVTCGQYRDFMASGGYQNPDWWSAEGWKWLQGEAVDRPLYWSENPAFNNHPVCGVSWYEAEAYCNFTGKRFAIGSRMGKSCQLGCHKSNISHLSLGRITAKCQPVQSRQSYCQYLAS